jgi:malonyl-CoA O-methyltransferase
MSDIPEPKTVFVSVEAAYDRWAAFYDVYDNPMVFMASQALRESMLAGKPAGLNVFEFGCGTGRNLALLALLGAGSLAGCDLSEGMLSVARQRCPGARLFRHEMTKELPGSFGETADLVLFCLTLEHIDSLTAPLSQARRILRPGGRVAIFEIHPFLSLEGVAAHFNDGGEEVRMPTVAHQFAAYLGAFARTGLQVELCREWRPRDVGTPAPLRALKRGPDFPMVVEFSLRAG